MTPSDTTTPVDPQLDPGASVTFIQHHAPPMRAGEYRLTLTQEVKIDGGSRGHEAYVTQAQFAVVGERCSLDPTEVNSVYPPPNAKGEYFNVLPHVVITRRALPWERSPLTSAAGMPGAGEGIPTWLALLVFDQADPPPKLTARTVRDLAPASAGGRLPDGVACYPGAHELDFGQAWDDPCQVIDVPLTLFRSIAPCIEDLRWLAHARRMSNGRKAAALDADTPAETDYAVIVANRLPRKGSETTVHLVSLEGMERYLPDAAGTGGAEAHGLVRLVSMKSWSFQSLDEAQSFSACLERLDCGLLRRADPGSGACDEADELVRDAMLHGYVPLDHRLRDGGRTISWFRGPFSPFPVPRDVAIPIASADAATRYDPRIGMFDVSYSLAWQLGRLLGLRDRLFSSALFRWKLGIRRDTADGAERAILAGKLADPDGGADLPGAAVRAMKAILGPGEAPAPPPAATGAPAAADDAPPTSTPPAVVIDALARLRLLKGAPFGQLVPDAAMLPPESIRFFHLDPNWIDALADGAFSLGRFTAGDLAHDEAHGPDLHAAAAKAASTLRRAACAGSAPRPMNASSPVTGFLLRSKAVGWWPGVEIVARDCDGTVLRFLRFERLSAGVLLCLFDGVLDTVVFSESPEAVHFGLDLRTEAALDQTHVFKRLRNLTGASTQLGPEAPVMLRNDMLVVRMAELASAIEDVLAAEPFTAAEFALEMVEGVGRVSFVASGGAAPGARR